MKTFLVKEARLAIRIEGWNKGTIAALKKLFTKDNPKFFLNKRLGLSTWKTPPKVKSWEQEDDDWLLLPREAIEKIREFLDERNIEIVKEVDKTVIAEPINFELKFPLYPYQELAVDKLMETDSGGLIIGPPASGKTSIALGYIARLNQPTLVVVHSGLLAKQWRERVIEWLNIIPGNIGGGKKDNIRPITIAMQQTLHKRKDANWLNDFGALVGDECIEAGAMIMMRDGTEKLIEEVQIGDNVAYGGKVLNTMVRKYEGKIYEFNKIGFTPNHPIATKYGWIPILLLHSSDKLFCGSYHAKKEMYHLWKINEGGQYLRLLCKTWPRKFRQRNRNLQTLWGKSSQAYARISFTLKVWNSWTVEQRSWFRRSKNRKRNCKIERKETKQRNFEENERSEGKTRSNRKISKGLEQRTNETFCQTRRNRSIEKTNKTNDQRWKDKALWWQRSWKWWDTYRIRNRDDKPSLFERIYSRVYTQNENGIERTSNTLQNRFGTSEEKNSSRNRWWESWWKNSKRDGRTQDIFPRIEELDSFEISGSFRLRQCNFDLSKSCEEKKTNVFNLETENGVYVAGNILVHNCHRWGAKTFTDIGTFFPAKHRVGFSADERRKDGMHHLIYETFGKVIHRIEKSELESIGRLVPVKLEIIQTDYIDREYLDFIDNDMMPDWISLIDNMSLDESRNEIILQNVIRVLKQNTSNRILILTELIKSVDYWVDTLRSLNIKVGKMIGGPPNREELETSILDLKQGNVRVGVGTKVADEGLDIPPLTHVFLICPIHKHPKRMIQMMGRTARRYKNKAKGVCVYFWDCNMFPPKQRDESERQHKQKQKAFIRMLKRLESKDVERKC